MLGKLVNQVIEIVLQSCLFIVAFFVGIFSTLFVMYLYDLIKDYLHSPNVILSIYSFGLALIGYSG
ncbi:hypothetical protein [Lactiplantibacillus modestisalitolerans]|uniref:Uncharacterized protein n=1 Tax=Lactiplantibacillus modestisalitolerans TaxID=1457219 RepID=A0ABV5WWS6_9LACO|nr:hypothetical protein [Lactiplantibacillus modestisalitolerans]